MKLKLKHVDCPGIVHRLEVPNECSLQEARERCRTALAFGPERAAGNVILSLNKKSPLVGDASDTLEGLGVCSGDLLWVLAPEVPHTVIHSSSASTAASRAAADSGSSGPYARAQLSRSHTPGTGAASASSAAQSAGAAAVARAQAQQVLPPGNHPTTTPALAGGDSGASVTRNTSTTCFKPLLLPPASGAAAEAMEIAVAGSAAMDIDVPPQQQQQQQQDLDSAGMGNAHEPGTAAKDEDVTAAAALAAAVDLDHPPAKPWMPDHLARILDHMQLQQQQLAPTQLLLLTVHAAMLESGLLCLQQQQQQQSRSDEGAAAVQVPQLIGCGGVYSLSYTLPNAAAKSSSDSSSSGGGGGSSSSMVLIGLKAVDVGNYLVLAGSITAAAAATATAASDGPTTTTSTKLVATINLPKAAASAPTAAQESSTPAATAALIYSLSDLPNLWVLLTDKLCLPLLVAGCAAAGIAAPVGLSSMPFELQEAVLSLLLAKDLAALCCTCTPMRHRAATDALWKPLFDQEFPSSAAELSTSSSSGSSSESRRRSSHPTAPYSSALYHTLNRIRQDANKHGWKWAFGAAWAQRRRILDEERRQARGFWPPHRAPYPNPMPWGPFRPQNPMMPSNIIGGDYDRFPNLGAFGGLGVQGFGGLGFSAGVLNPGVGTSSLSGIGSGSGGALFSGAQGGGGVLPGGGGSRVLGAGGGVGLGFPGLGSSRRREGGGGVGRLY